METALFWIVAPVSLGSAIAMVLARKAVHSALLLVLNFFTLAIFFVMLDADFLAAVQIIVYAGAIMVLFLFVIMLLGVDTEQDQSDPVRGQRTAAVLLGLVLAGVVVFTVRSALEGVPFRGLGQANTGGNVEALGRTLFTKYLWPFEITSLLLIIAAIGAIVIGRASGEADDAEIEPAAEEEQSAPAAVAAEPEPAPVPSGGPVAAAEPSAGGEEGA